MKNKLSLMLLALFASSCVLAQSNGTAGGLTWVLSADSVLTISGTGAMPDYDYTGGSVLAPWP
ncbi:MAG: hypothetical protein LBQ31_06100, partial [Bacteroidales bacterium]|nr:hypothetical protein [Bacteroidales bacterium]